MSWVVSIITDVGRSLVEPYVTVPLRLCFLILSSKSLKLKYIVWNRKGEWIYTALCLQKNSLNWLELDWFIFFRAIVPPILNKEVITTINNKICKDIHHYQKQFNDLLMKISNLMPCSTNRKLVFSVYGIWSLLNINEKYCNAFITLSFLHHPSKCLLF